MNVRIIINVTVTEDTNLTELRQRIADKMRELSNPLREDEGILVVNGVRTQS